MIACGHSNFKRHGRDRYGNQRYRCLDCGKTWIDTRPKLLGDMRIPLDRAIMCLRLLFEGNSIRSTERLTGTHRDTIIELIVLVGERCQRFMEDFIRDVPVNDVQADEIWGFVGCKRSTKNRLGKGDGFGDAYCFTAIERNTKLLLAWHLGIRSGEDTARFAQKLRNATTGRFQLTTDGYREYQFAVPAAMVHIDFAQLVKIFGKVKGNEAAVRYSPGPIIGTDVKTILGNPDKDKVCTSHAERHNLTIRMQMRRMTRLTNGFSKKWENHEAALAMFFAFYNFSRVHCTLKTTPAVAAGLTDHAWSVNELLEAIAL